MNPEKSMTFVVPVHGNSGLYLSRCLHSLLNNQDYEHKDVIVVFDGDEQMGAALKQKELFADDNRVQFHQIEHGGAPKARNYGLEKATGDYVCFFDCDSILQAGAIRTWIMEFEENPDCGFIYGSYRYVIREDCDDGIPAKPFDEYLLTCNNYISSMNPIKRELCPKWNEDLKSLQDWDFWLKVVRSGVKGHMINEWLVHTEPPSQDSLSGYSHANWIDCRNAVLESNNIKKRDTVITSMGAPYQSLRRAKFLDADYLDPYMLMFKPHEYKAIISMGYYIDSTVHPYTIFNSCNGAKKIIHWIGTDVHQLQWKKFKEVQVLREWLPGSVDKMFVNAPWLKDEMAEMGFETELLYCPIDSSNYKVSPLPDKFTVAVYRSDTNPMHNEFFMIDIARSCPDINFEFFGGEQGTLKHKVAKNVRFRGNIKDCDMPDFISSTSCLVRITVHDGFPATIAEWVMSGRPFISNLKDMPFNRFVDASVNEKTYILDKENVIKEIRKLQRSIRDKQLDFGYLDKAREHYINLLDPEKYRKRINEVIYA